MTLQEAFKEQMTRNMARAAAIVEKKNQDYANAEVTGDPFRNLRISAAIAHISVEQGILVRWADKLLRIGNLLENGEAAVAEESLDDNLIDSLNYPNLMLSFRQLGRPDAPAPTESAEPSDGFSDAITDELKRREYETYQRRMHQGMQNVFPQQPELEPTPDPISTPAGGFWSRFLGSN